MNKRIICFLSVLIMVISLLPTTVFASYPFPSPEDSPTSGRLSETITWEYNKDTATLYILGSGEMPLNYEPEWIGHAINMKHIVIGEGITAISKCAFRLYYRNVETIDIADSVTVIGKEAFLECLSLKTIDIPENVTKICESAFYGCASLTNINIPDSVTEIGYEAFAGCTALESITLPDDITVVARAFEDTAYSNNENNWKDGALYIGNTLIVVKPSISGKYEILPSSTSIAVSAFENCTMLSEVIIPEGITKICGRTFYGCTSLKSIIFPKGITKIDVDAFSGCTSLKSITIPEGVTEIEQSAFYCCSALESVYLPYSLKSLGGLTFTMCTSLKDVYYEGSEFDFLQRVNIGRYENYFDNVTFHYSVELDDTSKVFGDVIKTKWYSPYINYAYTNKLFNGTSDGTFEPDSPLTRAMFITVLWRISGDRTDINIKTKFTDVETDKWYSGAVAWAAENGIVNGVSDTLFGTEEKITREQMCVMLVHFAKYKDITFKNVIEKSEFVDENKMSSWSKDAIYMCQVSGIINGTVDGYGNPAFKPKNYATRAEASKILSVFHYDYIS